MRALYTSQAEGLRPPALGYTPRDVSLFAQCPRSRRVSDRGRRRHQEPIAAARRRSRAALSRRACRRSPITGVETVLDLRWPEEISAAPSPVPQRLPARALRVGLAARPTTRRTGAPSAAIAPRSSGSAPCCERLQPQLRTALAVIAAAGPGPLLFHCVAGKDRTGVIAALLLALADVVPAAIAADYAASTENLRDAYLRRYPDAIRQPSSRPCAVPRRPSTTCWSTWTAPAASRGLSRRHRASARASRSPGCAPGLRLERSWPTYWLAAAAARSPLASSSAARPADRCR